MGKTLFQILKEIPPDRTNNYSKEIKTVLSKLSSAYEELPKMTDTAMVVVVLIATMAFQAVVSPPGGVWQDDSSTHKAGEAVMVSSHPRIYKHFVRANTTAFASSLITIGFQSANILFMLFTFLTMWASLTAIAVSYGASLIVIIPNMEPQSFDEVITIILAVPYIFGGILFAWHGTRSLKSWWKTQKQRREDSRARGHV